MKELYYRLLNALRSKKLALPPSALELVDPKPEDAQFEVVFGGEIQQFGARPSKDWRSLYPLHEIQSYGDCVTFSRLNVHETLARAYGIKDPFGNELNLSDLYLAVKAGTTRTGNSMGKVSDVFYRSGTVLEKDCPYTRDWDEREAQVQRTPLSAQIFKGTNYSWVTPNRETMKAALDSSPIQIGVGLGETYQRADTVIRPPQTITVWHAMMCGYIDELGHLHCYDHYNRQTVILSADYPVKYCLSARQLPEDWKTKGNPEAEILHKRLIGKLILRAQANGELYRVYEDKLVKITFDISDKEIWNAVRVVLRPIIVGINEEDYKKVEQRIYSLGGKVEESDSILGLIGLIQ